MGSNPNDSDHEKQLEGSGTRTTDEKDFIPRNRPLEYGITVRTTNISIKNM